MFETLRRIFTGYRKWRKNWDALCRRCGKCCYQRSLSKKGALIIDYYAPCEYFDKKTKLCSVFERRYSACGHCGSVNLFCALFNPLLPPDCSYAQVFRIWRKKSTGNLSD